MANEKILNTRIQLKYDTLANWQNTNKQFVLKAGELAIVQVPTVEASTLQPVMFKVGDGSKTFNELDWASAKAADVYGWAKKSGIDVIDNGTGNVVSDIEWTGDALVITRIEAKTKQKQYSESGSSVKTITKVEQNENGEVTVTYEDIAFPVVELPIVSEGAGIDVKKDGLNYTVSHEDTSNVANVIAADRTYVKSLTFDDFGHVTGVTTGTETVVDTNTEYHIEYDSKNKQIKLVTGANSEKMTIPTDDFIKDGMIETVNLEDNVLVITWNTDAGKDVTRIELDHLIDVYTGKKGTTVEVTVSGNEISAEVIGGSLKDSHIASDAAIARTKLAKAVQDSLDLADTAVQPEDLGSMAKEDKNNYKTKQTAVSSPDVNGSTLAFIDTITQNENGVISVTKKNVNLSEYAKSADIGDGTLTLAGDNYNGLTGSATFSANQKGSSTFTVGIANKGVTTAKIADGAVGATQIKASKEYHNTKAADAEVWVFNCGSATELID